MKANPFERLALGKDGLLNEDHSSFHYVNGFLGEGYIVTERGLTVGHVDIAKGRIYFPNSPSRIANGLDLPYYEPPKADDNKLTLRSYFEDEGGENVWQESIIS